MGSPGTYVTEQKEETALTLIEKGLTTDGAQHKQYYLERLAEYFGIKIPSDVVYTKGIAP